MRDLNQSPSPGSISISPRVCVCVSSGANGHKCKLWIRFPPHCSSVFFYSFLHKRTYTHTHTPMLIQTYGPTDPVNGALQPQNVHSWRPGSVFFSTSAQQVITAGNQHFFSRLVTAGVRDMFSVEKHDD